jgi:hypothetical protein
MGKTLSKMRQKKERIRSKLSEKHNTQKPGHVFMMADIPSAKAEHMIDKILLVCLTGQSEWYENLTKVA